jgi:hypothetical protein
MKKLFSIWFLLFFVVTGNAQVNNKTKWSELNQDQLNLALKRSKKTIKTGKILTFVGLGVATIDMVVVFFAGGFGKSNGNSSYTGSFIEAGIITMYIGIPVWIVGATKKKNISLELVKFKPTGSASINGAGLKIRF